MAIAPDPSRPGGERAVGYVVGAMDSAAQDRLFARRYKPRILLRLFLSSWWRHPESFRQVLRFNREWNRPRPEAPAPGGTAPLPPAHSYSAHLHTNLLPEYQGKGLGSALMKAFLDELRARGAPGVWLGTSDRNLKAVPFYEKMGFQLVEESPAEEAWAGVPARGLTFIRSLT